MPRIVVGIDASSTYFLRTLERVRDPRRRAEVLNTLRGLLLLDLDQAPSKLHLHPLKNREGRSALDATRRVTIWTVHVTADDTLKASFTFENGVVYLRRIAEHDALDKDP